MDIVHFYTFAVRGYYYYKQFLKTKSSAAYIENSIYMTVLL